MEHFGANFTGAKGAMGRYCERQPIIYERGFMDFEDGSALAKCPDFERLMIDASRCKVHPHAAGAIGGNEGMGRTKGGSTQKFIWPWMRLVCRSEPLLLMAQELTIKKLSR